VYAPLGFKMKEPLRNVRMGLTTAEELQDFPKDANVARPPTGGGGPGADRPTSRSMLATSRRLLLFRPRWVEATNRAAGRGVENEPFPAHGRKDRRRNQCGAAERIPRGEPQNTTPAQEPLPADPRGSGGPDGSSAEALISVAREGRRERAEPLRF